MKPDIAQILNYEAEKMEWMTFIVSLAGIVIGVSSDLLWSRLIFALSLLVQGLTQAMTVVSLGMAKYAIQYRPRSVIYITNLLGLILTAVGIFALGCRL